MNLKSRITSLTRSSRGQSLVEFAMVLPLLLVIAFIITEFGRALWIQNVLTEAAGVGARAAIVATDDTYQAVAEAAANRILAQSGMDTNASTGAATVASELVGLPGGQTGVRVRVTRDFSFIPGGGSGELYSTPFAKDNNKIPFGTFTIAGESTMDCQPSFN